MNQEIRFCRTPDGVGLAYALSGRGASLVKSAHWLTHLDHDWRSPIWRHQHEGLSKHFRLLRYDQRGSGLSDREVDDVSLERWVSDLETVVDSAGLDRFILLGMSQGGPIAIEYAVRHPERVSHLVLFGSYVRGRRYWEVGDQQDRESDALVELIKVGWGRENPAFRQLFSSMFIPSGSLEQIGQFNELQRRSASAESAARMVAVIDSLDVTDAARRLELPTLVLHCEGDARIPFSEGRYLAAQIPGARFVPLKGTNHIMLEQDESWRAFLDEVLAFCGAGEVTPNADKAQQNRFETLTARERTVLDLLAAGAGNARIAEELHLSSKTVRNYVSMILDKLEVASRSEAIVAAREAGFGVSRPGD